MRDLKKKWMGLTTNQKLLVLVGMAVLVAAFLMLLSIWGIEINSEFLGRVLLTCLLIIVVGGILIMISSNMRDENKKDKDDYFN